jgi:hypothetical protein
MKVLYISSQNIFFFSLYSQRMTHFSQMKKWNFHSIMEVPNASENSAGWEINSISTVSIFLNLSQVNPLLS